MADTFNVTCGSDVQLTPEQIRDSGLFTNWLDGIEPGWTITSFHVVWTRERSAVAKGDTRTLIVMFATITAIDPTGRSRVSSALIKSDGVSVLPVLRTEDGRRYLLFVAQARAASCRTIVSVPSGVRGDMSAVLASLRRLTERAGLDLDWSRPKWLGPVVCASPGSSNEHNHYCTIEAHVTPEQLRQLQDHGMVATPQNGQATLRVVPAGEALDFLDCHDSSRDALMQVLMYICALRARRKA